MRRLRILEHAISSLWRRRFKNFSIVVVFTLVISALASILVLTHSLRVEARHLLQDAPDVVVQRLSGGRHDLIPVSLVDSIADLPGVRTVHPRFWGYYYDALTGANYTILGVEGVGPTCLGLLEGQLPDTPGACAIGSGVAGEITGRTP